LGLTSGNKGVFPFRMGEDGEKVMGGDITGCFFSTETKKNGFAVFEMVLMFCLVSVKKTEHRFTVFFSRFL
jgi:hypothetical protein